MLECLAFNTGLSPLRTLVYYALVLGSFVGLGLFVSYFAKKMEAEHEEDDQEL